jgi:hypothetical protein
MKALLSILICFALLVSFTSKKINAGETDHVVSLNEFQSFIDTIGLAFDMPTGYTPTVVKQNNDLWYAFALKHDKNDFEIRYSIWPLKEDFIAYNKCKLDTAHCTMVDPNRTFIGRAQSNVLNMTSGASDQISGFDEEAVKKEFNADAGGTSFFELHCDFGKGYKFGQMIVLHKDSVADVIITYLSNNKKTHSKLMNQAFHALRFK